MSKVKDKIEIIIADDHMMIREGLKQLLELDGWYDESNCGGK